jgi:hypothetical protein
MLASSHVCLGQDAGRYQVFAKLHANVAKLIPVG